MIRLFGVILPVFSKEQLGQTTQGYRSDESCQADHVPTIRTKRDDAGTVQESAHCHSQKERPRQVTVHAAAAGRVGQASGPHDGESDRPNRSSPASTYVIEANCDNRDDWQAEQDKR
jgi:hypothetical protein